MTRPVTGPSASGMPLRLPSAQASDLGMCATSQHAIGAARAVRVHPGNRGSCLLRAGRVHATPIDHRLAQQLVDAGDAGAGAGELRQQPQRNMLLAAMGAEGVLPVAASGAAGKARDNYPACAIRIDCQEAVP